MVDFAKCANGAKCPLKDNCQRWTVPAGAAQSYAAFYENERERCDKQVYVRLDSEMEDRLNDQDI